MARYTDRDTANRAATQVLRAHEERLRAWASAPAGTPRLHLYADLGHDVGQVLAGTDRAATPASSAVVLMTTSPGTGRPFIATSYPEIGLTGWARSRYPDLTLLFGGYFGQDHATLDPSRWRAEANLNTSTAPATRARVVTQLEELLLEEDEGLLRSVEALGSYVLPVQPRRWVTGLHRRMCMIDWTS